MQDSKGNSKALSMRPLKSNLALEMFLQCTLSDNTLVQNPPLASHHLRSMYRHFMILLVLYCSDSFLARSPNPTAPTQDSDKPNIFQFSTGVMFSLDYRTQCILFPLPGTSSSIFLNSLFQACSQWSLKIQLWSLPQSPTLCTHKVCC